MREVGAPPWSNDPPYESFRPTELAHLDEPSAARSGAELFDRLLVETEAGIASLAPTDVEPYLQAERDADPSSVVRLSVDGARWFGLDTWAAWSETPHLAIRGSAQQFLPSSFRKVTELARRLTLEKATGRLTVWLAGPSRPMEWRAHLRNGRVMRFELAERGWSLPFLAAADRTLGAERVARDAISAARSCCSIWEVWHREGIREGSVLRERLLRLWSHTLVSFQVVGARFDGGAIAWRGPSLAPSLLALLLYAAQTGQPRARWSSELEPYLSLKVNLIDRDASVWALDEPATDALSRLRTTRSVRTSLEQGAEPAAVALFLLSGFVDVTV
ncbi:MAG: hypothetical protein HC923_07965 [Myxococcales bacterium]|nr:hypothetical protein [Myxococcales bacterium]